MSTLTCPRCGASNVPSARYCNTCGTPLVAVPGPTPPVVGQAPPPPQPYYQYQYPTNYWEVVRSGKINNSQTGLLLLVIGVLIAWIPFAGFIGAIVGFIGAILVLIGRDPFGPDHVRNTTLAMIFFVVGIAVTIFGFFYSIIYYAQYGAGGSPFSALGPFSIILVIGGAIFGLSEVLLTYSLQRSKGHTLLWTAYGVSIAIGLVNILEAPLGNGIFSTLYSGTTVLFTSLLGAIPAAMNGTAFYLARERIVRHEIPQPMSQQAMGKPPW